MTATAPAPSVPADRWSTDGRRIVDASGATVGKASTMQGAINRLERIRREQRAAIAAAPADDDTPAPAEVAPDAGEALAAEVAGILEGRPVTVRPSLGDTVSVAGATPADASAAYYALTARYTLADMGPSVIVVTGRRPAPADPAPVRVAALPPVPAPSTSRGLPATDADDCTRAPAVGQLPGAVADPARRTLDRTDDEADEALAGEPDPAVLAGERCDRCRGFGLVRAAGKRAGQHYRSLSGAQAADGNGNAADCPDCHGLGLVGIG